MNVLILTLILSCLMPELRAATLNGTVRFEGKVPKPLPLSFGTDTVCKRLHKGPLLSEALVVGEKGGVANAFVFVKNGLPEKAYLAPAAPVIVDQVGCRFSPHAIALLVGQELEFHNSDGILHNVHCMSQVNTEINMAMPKFKKIYRKKFEKAEAPFAIKCDVHPWMGAWAAVFPHPFFSVSGKDGKFEIKDLPAGNYQVELWHEKFGSKTADVVVGDGVIETVDFLLP